MTSRRVVQLTAAAFAVAAPACVPIVQHGPWVREGASGALVVSGTYVTEEASGDWGGGVGIGVDGGMRAGYVPQDTNRLAFAAGAQLSLWAFLLASNLDNPLDAFRLGSADLYMTGPRSSRRTSTFGTTVGFYHVMPYFQIGNRSPANGGWYTTQAFLFLDEADFTGGFIWLPSIAFVQPSRGTRATHFAVGGGFGRRAGENWYIFSLATGVEFFRSNARVR